ncbi:MAG: DMT family transporter [Promethearchaeota archaeon]
MEKDNLKKGIFFGLICVTLVGIQPIIANSRPNSLDPIFFAATTCIVQAAIFFPLTLIERRKIKRSYKIRTFPKNFNELNSLLNGWKNNKVLLIYVGINFGIAQTLFYLGYQLAGAINGSLAQKTTVIFALLFGYLINREKISYSQIIFSFILLFGLALAITQGSFNLLEFNIGIILILITVILWMFAHAITKPIFDRKESTPIQMVFIRNLLSGLILISIYFLFFPIENIYLLFDPINQFYILAIGVAYGVGLFFWYKLLSLLGTSKATAMTSGTPIITIIFAILILGEILTIFHIIGTILVIISVIMIMKPREERMKELEVFV